MNGNKLMIAIHLKIKMQTKVKRIKFSACYLIIYVLDLKMHRKNIREKRNKIISFIFNLLFVLVPIILKV